MGSLCLPSVLLRVVGKTVLRVVRRCEHFFGESRQWRCWWRGRRRACIWAQVSRLHAAAEELCGYYEDNTDLVRAAVVHFVRFSNLCSVCCCGDTLVRK
jgi:hypothetical protein